MDSSPHFVRPQHDWRMFDHFRDEDFIFYHESMTRTQSQDSVFDLENFNTPQYGRGKVS